MKVTFKLLWLILCISNFSCEQEKKSYLSISANERTGTIDTTIIAKYKIINLNDYSNQISSFDYVTGIDTTIYIFDNIKLELNLIGINNNSLHKIELNQFKELKELLLGTTSFRVNKEFYFFLNRNDKKLLVTNKYFSIVKIIDLEYYPSSFEIIKKDIIVHYGNGFERNKSKRVEVFNISDNYSSKKCCAVEEEKSNYLFVINSDYFFDKNDTIYFLERYSNFIKELDKDCTNRLKLVLPNGIPDSTFKINFYNIKTFADYVDQNSFEYVSGPAFYNENNLYLYTMQNNSVFLHRLNLKDKSSIKYDSIRIRNSIWKLERNDFFVGTDAESNYAIMLQTGERAINNKLIDINYQKNLNLLSPILILIYFK